MLFCVQPRWIYVLDILWVRLDGVVRLTDRIFEFYPGWNRLAVLVILLHVFWVVCEIWEMKNSFCYL